MVKFSSFILPAVVTGIIVFGLFKDVKVFDCFTAGAKKGVTTFVSLIPPVLALILMVSLLNESGAMAIIGRAISPLTRPLGIPDEVTPLCLLSPLSGSGSMAMYEKIIQNAGPDSLAGRIASVIAASTETTFYAVTVYYGAVGIKKTRYTLPAALCADLTSFVVSAWAVKLLFIA